MPEQWRPVVGQVVSRLTATEREYVWRNRNGLLWRFSIECHAWQFYSKGEQCWIGAGAQMGPANDFGPFTQVADTEEPV